MTVQSMKSKIWTDWSDLKNKIVGRRVFFYGCSQDWSLKALTKIDSKIEGFIDNDGSFSNEGFLGFPVKKLADWELNFSNEFFLITTGQYEQIEEELLTKGYSPGVDFVCSPDFKNYLEIEKLLNRQCTILFSSPDYPSENRARGSKEGGGLFLLNSQSGKVDRVFRGSFRQLEIVGDFILAVDHVHGLLCKLDHNFDLVESLTLGSSGWCGLAFSEDSRTIWVSNPTTDEIFEVSFEKLAIVASRQLCGQINGAGGHHLNDLEYMPGRLLASYFSFSGDKMRGEVDGGVSAIDGTQFAERYFDGLNRPHSPKFADGRLWALESGQGKLISDDAGYEIDVGGFVRGLDFNAELVAVGQSRCMYLAERVYAETLVEVDCGVRLINWRAKLSRFIAIPDVKNVHDLRFWSY